MVRTWGFHCHGPGPVSAQETKAPTSHAVKKINWSIKLEVRLLVPRHVLSHFVVSDSLWITEYWSGLPCPPPGVLPNPRREPRSPTLQVDSLLSEPPGKPKNTGVDNLSLLQRIFLVKELNWVFCIAGGFFTSWAPREAPNNVYRAANIFSFFLCFARPWGLWDLGSLTRNWAWHLVMKAQNLNH